MKQYGLIMMSTTELVVTIVVLILAGQWVDKHYQTGSKGVMISAVVGSILGFVRFVIRLQKLNKESDPGAGE